jgi:hypothetical protein
MGHRCCISELVEYFEGRDCYTAVSNPSDFIDFACRGDFVALDTNGDGDRNHSAMILAHDISTGILWTLDGNTSGTSDWTYSGYEARRGGSEVFIRDRDPDEVTGWGYVKSSLL